MPDEERERHDRELDELSSELRTVLPGVTVLFAFLLTVPFASVGALALLAVALSAVAYLVGSVVYGPAVALVVSGGLLVLATVTWFALPLRRRRAVPTPPG